MRFRLWPKSISLVSSVVGLSIFLTASMPLSAQGSPACASAFGESTRPQLYDNLAKPLQSPQFKNPARIVLTKFTGHGDFQSGTSQSWTSDGRHFLAGQAKATWLVGHSKEESLFANQQDFSLGKMVETGYLTSEQARLFRKDALNREPDQISFLEVVHDATPEEIKATYAQYPVTRVAGTHAQDHTTSLQAIKTAALYSASGQVWSQTGQMKRLPLPWEKEEARKGQRLDREGQYKFVWEWGRAGQDAAGEIAPLYAANALLNYVDLVAHGGSLDHAYVMVHSFDKINTRLYSRMHPGTQYPKEAKDPNDMLFLVPLREALEKYKPSSISAPVSEVMRLSGGKLSDLQALDLLIDARLYHWSELDYQNYQGLKQESPIIMNDMSNMRASLIVLSAMKRGLDREGAMTVTDYILGISNLLHTTNANGKYNNAADSLMTSYQYLHRFNGIEISNLDPAMAKKDPFYAGSVLMSAYTQYVRNMAAVATKAHGISYEKAYAQALQTLTDGPVTFGITTHSPDVEAQVKKLQPSRVSEQKAMIVKGGSVDPIEKAARPYLYRDARLYIFTAAEVRKLITLHPDFYQAAGAGLYNGAWRAHYLLSQPDLF